MLPRRYSSRILVNTEPRWRLRLRTVLFGPPSSLLMPVNSKGAPCLSRSKPVSRKHLKNWMKLMREIFKSIMIILFETFLN